MTYKIEKLPLRLTFTKSSIYQSRELMRNFWNKTAPVLLNELVWGGGFTMYSVVIGRLGADAVAANSNFIGCLLRSVSACPVTSYYQNCTPDPDSRRLFKRNAHNLFLLSDWKINQQYDHRRNFSGRRGLPVLTVYFCLNLDEIVKLPVVYRHYKKYK